MDAWLWVLFSILVGLPLTIIVAWWLLRRFARPPNALLERIGRLTWRQRLGLGSALMRDPRLPMRIRLLMLAVGLYLVMPLDIIPDFIPVVGALDDVLIVLIALRLLLRSIPESLLDEHLREVEGRPAAASLSSAPAVDPTPAP